MTTKLTIALSTLLFVLACFTMQAQTIEKSIIIEQNGNDSKVTIVTKENGTTETEILEGEDACKYIREHQRTSSGTIAKAQVTNLDIETVGNELDRFGDGFYRVIIEMNDGDINSAMSIVDDEVKITTKNVRSLIDCAL